LAGKANSRCQVRLFCLPYAGAGSSRYFRWVAEFPKEIDVRPVLLPGREGRIGEPPYSNMDDLTSVLSLALVPELDRQFAIFVRGGDQSEVELIGLGSRANLLSPEFQGEQACEGSGAEGDELSAVHVLPLAV
jgi:hypothetical protein